MSVRPVLCRCVTLFGRRLDDSSCICRLHVKGLTGNQILFSKTIELERYLLAFCILFPREIAVKSEPKHGAAGGYGLSTQKSLAKEAQTFAAKVRQQLS